MDVGAVGEVLIGFFMPLVFAAILQRRWSPGAKQVVSFVLYMGVAFFVWTVENDDPGIADWREFVVVAANIIIGGTAGYFGLWRRTLAAPIEAKTDIPAKE